MTEPYLYKRALACAELLFPHLQVLGEAYDDYFVLHVKRLDGLRVSLAFEANASLAKASNAELLEQIREAAHRYALSTRGRIQPYVPGVDPEEPWPELKPINAPPSDNRKVCVYWERNSGVGKFESGEWLTTKGEKILPMPAWGDANEIPLTHWRDLSAYEKATAV